MGNHGNDKIGNKNTTIMSWAIMRKQKLYITMYGVTMLIQKSKQSLSVMGIADNMGSIKTVNI